MEKQQEKFYGVYFAYSQYEITNEYDETKPRYPKEYARVRVYNTKMEQMNAFANTMCPASQTFEFSSKEEYDKIVKDYENNFEDEEWLSKNIDPYI